MNEPAPHVERFDRKTFKKIVLTAVAFGAAGALILGTVGFFHAPFFRPVPIEEELEYRMKWAYGMSTMGFMSGLLVSIPFIFRDFVRFIEGE